MSSAGSMASPPSVHWVQVHPNYSNSSELNGEAYHRLFSVKRFTSPPSRADEEQALGRQPRQREAMDGCRKRLTWRPVKANEETNGCTPAQGHHS